MRNIWSFGLVVVACSVGSLFNPTFAAPNMDCSKATQDLSQTPPQQIGMYLDGFHSYRREAGLSSEKQKQIRTAHFCKQVNPDLYQCLIYDGNTKDARVIGVEY